MIHDNMIVIRCLWKWGISGISPIRQMAMLIQSGSKQEAMYPGDEVNYNQSEVRSLKLIVLDM